MKNSKRMGFRILALIIPILVFFSSCNEEQLEENTKLIGPEAETIDELTVSEFFDWKTTNEITVNIEGLPVDVGVNQKLTLLTSEGTEIFGGSQKMHEDFEMTFDLPSSVDVIVMKYGGTEKSSEVKNNVASFNFELERDADEEVVEFAELSAK
ncbi:hypothetical protein [Cyclobacterium amurskyense]|uniref:hypothetical protein n=1 Tax=Cyclobacterium amurskyense TaxID=320787 RepID=UPI0030D850A9|tara:strand:- start:12591 stop:13052 length:462 start_codon:yes stop_codon:yes gene_type:complete